MNQTYRLIGLCIVSLPALWSCAGYERVFLATKTNVGLDVDTQPPTAELTIARRELNIQPTFPAYGDANESVLPTLATFGLRGGLFDPQITGHFAGGKAAVELARSPSANASDVGTPPSDRSGLAATGASAEPSFEGDSPSRGAASPSTPGEGGSDYVVCLKEKPDQRSWMGKLWEAITGESQKSSRPFYFATDTAFGLKVMWSGTAGPYPDSLKLGYNRKEFASPPIFVEQSEKCNQKGSASSPGGWQVRFPSFYASIDNGQNFEKLTDSKTKHVQFFATGRAAWEFAMRPSVRAIAFRNMAPDAAAEEASQLGLNAALLADISKDFTAAEATEKSRIVRKAEDLELVTKASDGEGQTDRFLEYLDRVRQDPSVTTTKRLYSLRKCAGGSC